MLKNILQRALRGLVYSAVLALLGAAFSLMRGKPLMEGAYLFVLSGGVLAMVFSIFPLVGTPAMTYATVKDECVNQSCVKTRGWNGVVRLSSDAMLRSMFSWSF